METASYITGRMVLLGLNLVATTTNTGNTLSWADLLYSASTHLITLTG